jgi:hypothetical protein
VIERFTLIKVQYMPAALEPGVLYLAEEFGSVAHLCACGCGAVVRTPLDESEWSLEETAEGPSLHPSIGNWQEPCQSHYWIIRGRVIWAPQWNAEQIEAGRNREQERRVRYYKALARKRPSRPSRASNYLSLLARAVFRRLAWWQKRDRTLPHPDENDE